MLRFDHRNIIKRLKEIWNFDFVAKAMLEREESVLRCFCSDMFKLLYCMLSNSYIDQNLPTPILIGHLVQHKLDVAILPYANCEKKIKLRFGLVARVLE